ncbi:MAG: inositol monophosphatase family protein [Nanoarchaeota archaeon]
MAALVATGQFEATVFPHYEAHDTAAVKVIVEEAGGKVTDLFGKEQRYDRDIRGHIVSNGFLHQKLVKLVRDHVLNKR